MQEKVGLIKLSSGELCILDFEDLPLVEGYSWYAHRRNGSRNIYARTYVESIGGKPVQVMMHRLLMNPPGDMVVDHINGIGLDNRRSINLRICSPSENSQNQSVGRGSGTYVGVRQLGDRFAASASINKKQVYLGCYESPEEAAMAHDSAVAYYKPGYGGVNFPREIILPRSIEDLRQNAKSIPRKAVSAGGSTEYRGVVCRSGGEYFTAQISPRSGGVSRQHFLGRYPTALLAAEAYDRAARHFFGSGAAVNFPERNLPAAEPLELRHGYPGRGSSLFRGVSRRTHAGTSDLLWQAGIRFKGRSLHLGSYPTEREAAEAYDAKAMELYGDRATLNFPPKEYAKRAKSAVVRSRSGYLGVSQEGGHFYAVIYRDKKRHRLGRYVSATEAAKAYDAAARRFGGEKFGLNFPDMEIESQRQGLATPFPSALKSGIIGT